MAIQTMMITNKLWNNILDGDLTVTHTLEVNMGDTVTNG